MRILRQYLPLNLVLLWFVLTEQPFRNGMQRHQRSHLQSALFQHLMYVVDHNCGTRP